MGYARRRPERLAEKLRKIRNTLSLSQTELHKSLGVEKDIPYTRISDYELGKNEPTLIVLLENARVVGVHLETIVDDRLDLPVKLPGTVKYEPKMTIEPSLGQPSIDGITQITEWALHPLGALATPSAFM